MPATTEFTELTEPFRRELTVHCYRMLGSTDEAEDLVQETYFRAWRSYDGFEGRSSLRTWLYRIATNACLNALESRAHRPLPSGLSAPNDDPTGPLAPARHDIPWLQPFPDRIWQTDPATIVTSRASVRLALIATLQHLPARQRVALILRDVLSFSIPEIATLLSTTKAAINSALQRARAHLDRVHPDALTDPPLDPAHQSLLDRYQSAFEKVDIVGLTELLAEDATWEMPPRPDWFAGRHNIAKLIETRSPLGSRLLPTHANAQPAFAMYTPHPSGSLHPHSIQVLTLSNSLITRITAFHTPTLFPAFNLPPTLTPIPLR